MTSRDNLNTAIFYDIENLIGGYGKATYLEGLSLKAIRKDIDAAQSGRITIQKAYANWGDMRLNALRNDIIELGIEPVQMFGFGRGATKNASDIHLAIDATEIGLTNKTINRFVIVSGDGGFTSLVGKLHSYGHYVIGCAYKTHTNTVFRGICDEFICIPEPVRAKQTENNTPFNDPILSAYAEKYQPESISDSKKICQIAYQILAFLENYADSKFLMDSVGLNISVFSQLMNYHVPDINYLVLGLSGLVDFLRYITNDTNIKLILSPPSEYRLVFKNKSIPHFEAVDPIPELGEIHTEENYRTCLAKHAPTFKLSTPEMTRAVIGFMAERKIQFADVSLEYILDILYAELDGDDVALRGTVLSLIAAGCFVREPDNAKLHEQKLSFIPVSSEQTEKILKEKCTEKLVSVYGEIQDDILSNLVL